MNQDLNSVKAKLIENLRKKYSKKYYFLKQDMKTLYGKIIRSIKRPAFPGNEDGKVYLHLGCGMVNHPSFINIDGMAYPHIHYVRPINNLKPFKNQTVELIYASHCLEHFPFAQVKKVIVEWHRVLKEGGILRLSVPDFDLLLDIYKDNNKDIETIIVPLMGGQDYQYNFHMTAFNEAYLTKLLKKAGFSKIQKWIPGSSEMTTFNDCSNLSIIQNGKAYPVSLNIEGIK